MSEGPRRESGGGFFVSARPDVAAILPLSLGEHDGANI